MRAMRAMRAIENIGQGILVAPPGTGKTVIACAASSAAAGPRPPEGSTQHFCPPSPTPALTVHLTIYVNTSDADPRLPGGIETNEFCSHSTRYRTEDLWALTLSPRCPPQKRRTSNRTLAMPLRWYHSSRRLFGHTPLSSSLYQGAVSAHRPTRRSKSAGRQRVRIVPFQLQEFCLSPQSARLSQKLSSHYGRGSLYGALRPNWPHQPQFHSPGLLNVGLETAARFLDASVAKPTFRGHAQISAGYARQLLLWMAQDPPYGSDSSPLPAKI